MTEIGKPPPPWLIAYRVFGLRLPEQYRPWVARDVESKHFVTWRGLRTVLWGLVLVGIFYVVQSELHQPPDTRTTMFRLVAVVLIVALLASRQTLVRRTLAWQRVDKRGHAAQPKRLALLDNDGALVLGALVLVLFTGATSVFAHWSRPTGDPSAADCDDLDRETHDRITAGLKDAGATLDRPKGIHFGNDLIVVSYVDRPNGNKGFGIFLVDETAVYEFRPPDKPEVGVTTFDPPKAVDRVVTTALQRVARCLPRR